jgi:hypothetical protein
MSTLGASGDVLVARPAPLGETARRIIAAAVAIVCAGVLGVASWLTPSPSGLGTHRQFHLPDCTWITAMNLPCPTCGMTTSFAHAADGNVAAALRAQPLGLLLALATAMTMLVGVHVAVTGSRLHRPLMRLLGARAAWGLAIAVLAAWAFKVLDYKGVFE